MSRQSTAARVVLAPALAAAAVLLVPGIALADNCSSLGDCWSTASGAASAAAGTAFGAIGGLLLLGTGPSGGSSKDDGVGPIWPTSQPDPRRGLPVPEVSDGPVPGAPYGPPVSGGPQFPTVFGEDDVPPWGGGGPRRGGPPTTPGPTGVRDSKGVTHYHVKVPGGASGYMRGPILFEQDDVPPPGG